MITEHKIVASTINICKEVVVHVENSVRCEEFEILFYKKYNLKTHLKTHHSKQGKWKICD